MDSPAGLRQPLLFWLLRKYPDTPKTRAKEWIVAGRVSVDGVVIRQPHAAIADPGQGLKLLGPHAATLDLGEGWPIHPKLVLIHLDPALAVVNKAPGLLSVPAPNHELSALDVLGRFLADPHKAQSRGDARRTLPPRLRGLSPLPVHRIDQFTSGLFCFALNPNARIHLIEQVRHHTVQREYIAFVEGKPAKPQGTWRDRLCLGADQMHQQVVSSRPGGARSESREAVTHYEVLAEYPLGRDNSVISKLRIRLETGLKHQIRVQAAAAGLPLVGDRTYNPHYRAGGEAGRRLPFERQALHAARLELEHPEHPGRRMSWTAPLPRDLEQLESRLKRGV